MNLDHTRRADTDHPVFQPMQVSSHLTSISIVENNTIGAHAVTLKSIHGVMVNASGSLQETDQFHLMSLNQVTSRCATANSLLMHHSAMEPINI